MSTLVSPGRILQHESPDSAGFKPKLGFLGVGWIGRNRLQSLVRADVATVVAVSDRDDQARDAACELSGASCSADSVEELLEQDLDGIVIATPSALHADQALQALRRGIAVFCQKPLARTVAETRCIISAAREANLLLGVDFSYRHVRGIEQMRQLVQSGELGELFAVDLTFHNAYGPDKGWFYQPELSGGGCVIDLGIHLVDLAMFITGDEAHEEVRSTLWREGQILHDASAVVEDCAFAEWRMRNSATARLACSWHLSAGQDAVIEAIFYGTQGAVAIKNVGGSFYDFTVEHWQGTTRHTLARPPDDWGGRALIHWAQQLSAGAGSDAEIEDAAHVAALIDDIYHAASDRGFKDRRSAPGP